MRLFNYSFLHPWRWLPPLLLSLVLAVSTVSHAQANDAQQVVVTLRDAANRGLDQVVITLQTPGGTVSAQGETDHAGQVRLTLPAHAEVLRLTVRGVGATGRPLQLAANERDGISMHLLMPSTEIALRVEDDGTVLPDPTTMAEPEGIPLPPAPTRQPPAPTAASTTSELAPQQPAPPEFVDANGQPIAEPSSAPLRTLLFLLALLVGTGCIVIGLWRLLRRGAQ